MARRALGSTGLMVSPVAFGAFKIGRNQKTKYPLPYELPGDADAGRLLHEVLDAGINVIDTAPAYGHSEALIGKHLSSRRSEFVLCTKVGERFEDGVSDYDFTAAGVQASVERSLRELRTDAVDVLYIHSDGRDAHILRETDAPAAVASLKQTGKARWIGMSAKTVEGAREAMAWADVLMLECHPLDGGMLPVINEAGRRGIGVTIKKPLAAGRVPPGEAIPFVLGQWGVSTLVIGSLSAGHMRENLRLAESFLGGLSGGGR